jgi:hypothetical protein
MKLSIETIGARIKMRKLSIDSRQFPSFEAISLEEREFDKKKTSFQDYKSLAKKCQL